MDSRVYTKISDITKFLKKKKEKLNKNQEYTKNLKKYYINKEHSRGVQPGRTQRFCLIKPGRDARVLKTLGVTTQCSREKKLKIFVRPGERSEKTKKKKILSPIVPVCDARQFFSRPQKNWRLRYVQLKKKLEEMLTNNSTPKKIKFYKYHKRLFKLSSSGLFLRKKRTRPSNKKQKHTGVSRPQASVASLSQNCQSQDRGRPCVLVSPKTAEKLSVSALSKKPQRIRPSYRIPSEHQDLLFLKYLLKLNISAGRLTHGRIQNSFFFFQGALRERSDNHAVKPYLLTNSIENIESILYKTLKCNTSVLPLKIKNPLKSAYFLALFIGNGIKQKRSLRQIFKLITKMKKKSETSKRRPSNKKQETRNKKQETIFLKTAEKLSVPSLRKNCQSQDRIKIVSPKSAKKLARADKGGNRRATIKGIRILCSGRINGVEKAKTQSKRLGQTSLHFFSEKIDYSCIHVNTKFGIIGVKVWICFKK
uniref:40S ribosomal protein S3 n=1 Tax=Cymbomonas tetramitiformis TaxID=36881 RepID=A0A1S5R1Y0_9CHLO|nr:ribosomal protein S3 [Cymbomonas tetramitiformis]ANA57095.1 ribosomal protein S3 [Cymbomonas tetramitiformis]